MAGAQEDIPWLIYSAHPWRLTEQKPEWMMFVSLEPALRARRQCFKFPIPPASETMKFLHLMYWTQLILSYKLWVRLFNIALKVGPMLSFSNQGIKFVKEHEINIFQRAFRIGNHLLFYSLEGHLYWNGWVLWRWKVGVLILEKLCPSLLTLSICIQRKQNKNILKWSAYIEGIIVIFFLLFQMESCFFFLWSVLSPPYSVSTLHSLKINCCSFYLPSLHYYFPFSFFLSHSLYPFPPSLFSL